ncbi:MAG: Flp pilus assembly protein CpaB [Clostridiales bacterium]|nr:Flp pilus assembly protein CpaB [Clostridiales bacterium]MCF8023052.1 Flp pilus assembly protein CpaB [Clostridiales bacterium]
MKNKLILLIAILFAIIAAFGTYKYLHNVKETYRESGNYSKVAIAAKNIPAKTPITGQMLKFKDMPAKYILPGSIMNAKDAVGKISRTDIYAGEQLLQKKLISKNSSAGGISSKIKPGMRAVTIPVDNVSAVAGLVTPGDKIDISLTMGDKGDMVTGTILHKIPILAINQTTSHKNKKFEPATATLMVKPEQAQKLILASKSGSIHFMLRSPNDDKAAGIPPAKKKELLH